MTQCVLLVACLLLPELALAQADSGGSSFFCSLAKYFKDLLASMAILAILIWAADHIFEDAKVHRVIVRIGVALFMVLAAASIIAATGLKSACSL